jgi:hypothetical protein
MWTPCAPRNRMRRTVQARTKPTAPTGRNRSRRDRAADAARAATMMTRRGRRATGRRGRVRGRRGEGGAAYPVILNTDSSVRGTERLGPRRAIVRARLRHLAPHLTRVEAYITDASRGSNGRHRPSLRAGSPADGRAKPVAPIILRRPPRRAVRGAAGKLARLLEPSSAAATRSREARRSGAWTDRGPPRLRSVAASMQPRGWGLVSRAP